MKINIFKITTPEYPLFILFHHIEYKTNFPNFVRRNINTYEKYNETPVGHSKAY